MSLKVIGAALPRTGTISLKVALEMLGFGRCYHMAELIMHPEHAPYWAGAMAGEPQWDTLFEGYQATADFPACLHWRALAEHYPDAKVILTTRSAESWAESVLTTVGQPAHGEAMFNSPIGSVIASHPIKGVAEQDPALMIEGFHEYQAAVKAALPPGRLLVFSAADGWEPLCAFLGVPVPDVPYPKLNSREDIRDLVEEDGRAASFEDIQAHIRSIMG